MANIKQQKKRIRTSEENRQRNQAVRSRVRTMIKKANEALESKDQEQIGKILPETLSAIDNAAQKGVIHRNSAARKKSHLQHRASHLSS